MEEFNPEYQNKVINFALKENSFELIFQLMEDKLDEKESKELEKAFKKWLFNNPKAYHLFLKEYTPVYKKNNR